MENKNFMTITYNFMNYNANRKKVSINAYMIMDITHYVIRIMAKF